MKELIELSRRIGYKYDIDMFKSRETNEYLYMCGVQNYIEDNYGYKVEVTEYLSHFFKIKDKSDIVIINQRDEPKCVGYEKFEKALLRGLIEACKLIKK